MDEVGDGYEGRYGVSGGVLAIGGGNGKQKEIKAIQGRGDGREVGRLCD